MKKPILFAAAAAMFVGAALCLLFCGRGESAAEGDAAEPGPRLLADAGARGRRGEKSAVRARSAGKAKVRRALRSPAAEGGEGGSGWTLDDFDDADHPYSVADKKAALELQLAQDALDEFDDEAVAAAERSRARGEQIVNPAALRAKDRFSAAAAAAAASANPAVRREALDAYSWRGGDYLPELTPMMADADAEVAEAAIDAVQTALDEMENPSMRFETAAAYVSTFSVNEEALDMLGVTMVSSAHEIIDAEDDTPEAERRALASRTMVVDTLATLIENGNGKSVDTAKEAYGDIASEDWISREEARKWAQDPDDYEAPEI